MQLPPDRALHRFGSTDLRVSTYGLGCARIGGIFQGGKGGFLDLYAAAFDAGINFYDTADMYAQGESEQLLGEAFRKRRSQIVIASKAGYVLPQRRMLAARLKPLLRPLIRALKIRRDKLPTGARGALAQDFSPKYLRRAVEGSLRRLRTDYLDLLQLHSPPEDVVARGEWEPELESLKRAGKIRWYGVAVDTIEAGLAALKFPGVSSIQFTLNLLEPGAVERLLPRVREREVAFIARECLGNGLLVKRESEIDLAKYCASEEQQAQRRDQLATLRARAADEGRSLASLAIDFASSAQGVSVTLLGARSVDQLRGLLRDASRAAA